MKRKTYNNILKAARIIQRTKHYDKETSLQLAIQCFDNLEATQNGMTVEWFISRLATREEYESENAPA